jgi:hypothetical protein
MKKISFIQRRMLAGIFFSLSGLLVAFWGCNKTHTPLTNAGKLPETNVRLVPDSVARRVAVNFSADDLYGDNKGTNHYPYKSALHGNNSIKNFFVWKDRWGQPAVYVYNFTNNGGFLLVSADSALSPILAFVERGEYQKDSFPAGVDQWVKSTMSNIGLVRAGLYKPNTPASAWGVSTGRMTRAGNVKIPDNSPGGPPPNCIFTTTGTPYTVGPLLSTTWGQECTYNELCGSPGVNYTCTDGFSCSAQPPTGCVATSVAQIVYYWQPGNQYNYNYAFMPLDQGNAEVERLMRDIGLPENADMAYGCAAAGGSGANGDRILGTLYNFGIRNGYYRAYDYNTVVNDINNNHYPVLLGGCTSSVCHEWVCDGYSFVAYSYTSSCNPGHVYPSDPGNFMFHMNWGWHEIFAPNDFNGWYWVNNWNANGNNFQFSQTMTTNIHL